MSYVSQDSNKTHPKCISNSSKFPSMKTVANIVAVLTIVFGYLVPIDDGSFGFM